jgi:hypothetical protein
MLLASVTDILDALGFDAMTDITSAATMALDAAEAQLASTLDTDFTQGSYVDTFYVEEPPFRSGPAASTEFRLSHGLVSTLTSVIANGDPTAFGTSQTVTYNNGSGWPYAFSPGENLDVTANCSPQFLGQFKERGVVRDFMTRYCRTWVQISYTSGFPADGTNPASYDLTQVPDWLQQAAKTCALINLSGSPALSEANVKLDVPTLKVQFRSLLTRRIRYAPMALLPL